MQEKWSSQYVCGSKALCVCYTAQLPFFFLGCTWRGSLSLLAPGWDKPRYSCKVWLQGKIWSCGTKSPPPQMLYNEKNSQPFIFSFLMQNSVLFICLFQNRRDIFFMLLPKLRASCCSAFFFLSGKVGRKIYQPLKAENKYTFNFWKQKSSKTRSSKMQVLRNRTSLQRDMVI